MARELLGLHAEEFVPSSPATRLLIAAGALPPASPAVAVLAAEGDCAEPEGGGRASPVFPWSPSATELVRRRFLIADSDLNELEWHWRRDRNGTSSRREPQPEARAYW